MIIMSDSTIALWDRQKGETGKAYEAFVIYRDLGLSRTQQEVCTRLRKSYEVIQKWSHKNAWQDRCLAYDRYMDKRTVESTAEVKAKAIAEMYDRQLDTAKLFHSVIRKKLNRFVDQVEFAEANKLSKSVLDDIDIAEAEKMFVIAADLERRLVGEPSQYIKQDINMNANVNNTVEEIHANGIDKGRLANIIAILNKSIESSGLASTTGKGVACGTDDSQMDEVHSDKPN
jgi:hypothetical protein